MPRAPWLPRSGQCRRDDTRVVHDTVSAFVHSPFGAPRLPGGFWGANRGGTAAAVGAWPRRWVGAAAGAWSHSGALRGRSCATLGSEQCVLLWDRFKPSCSRAGTAAATPLLGGKEQQVCGLLPTSCTFPGASHDLSSRRNSALELFCEVSVSAHLQVGLFTCHCLKSERGACSC